HADQSPLAPEGYLTGAEWDWVSIYTFLGEQFVAGKTLMAGDIDHILRGGLADNFCKLSAYGPAVSDEAIADADAAKEKILKGELVIYEGELKDNTGKAVLAAGEKYEQQNIELEKMDWLIEGVKGSIDG
ncbi:MAG: BMP family ABC transporter substrate-binding protein, partial [Cyanobacteria bacterium J06636_28]